MSATINKESYNVGGIRVHVFVEKTSTDRDVVILFFLHGRGENSEGRENVVYGVFEQKSKELKKGLVVVTFDHRNHGHRLVDPQGNWGWGEESYNQKHALDMYCIQIGPKRNGPEYLTNTGLAGSAKDISFLIDFLPPYIYPNREHEIIEWGIAGISLGGHSTWLALTHEPRLSFGIPIIGCPDFFTLISERAEKNGISLEDTKYFPVGLRHLILRDDPAAAPYEYEGVGSTNPFIGKKILVLSGADDTLVPWSASRKFVEGLTVGEKGEKKVLVQPGVGHVCSEEMISEMAVFISKILAN